MHVHNRSATGGSHITPQNTLLRACIKLHLLITDILRKGRTDLIKTVIEQNGYSGRARLMLTDDVVSWMKYSPIG